MRVGADGSTATVAVVGAIGESIIADFEVYSLVSVLKTTSSSLVPSLNNRNLLNFYLGPFFQDNNSQSPTLLCLFP